MNKAIKKLGEGRSRIELEDELSTLRTELIAEVEHQTLTIDALLAAVGVASEKIERLSSEGRNLRRQLLHFAAECHRGKWSYEHDHPPAFQFLDALGQEIGKAFDTAALVSSKRSPSDGK